MITVIGEIASRENDRFLKMWQTNVDPATRLLQDHRHVNFEIALVIRGQGTYQTVNGRLPIAPGDVFVFPSNQPHWILEIREGGLEIINLHMNLPFFRAACSISQQYPNLFFTHSPGFPSRIPAEKSRHLQTYMQNIRRELQDRRPEYTIYIHAILNILFAHLVRDHGYYLPEEGTHAEISRILPSLRFIDANFSEAITLEQIAAESGLSPNYFTKLFKDCFHIRLWDYVISKRVEKARRLLSADTGNTVLEVALSCGFNNTANFNRAFLRFTGLTPSEFRQKRGTLLH